MKVKRQRYLGKPLIAIYMRDATKKVKARLQQMIHLEERANAQQTESFTQTLSHEMRTPLASTLFFLRQVLQMTLPLPTGESAQASKYLQFMLSQLTLTMSFVEDLLDLRLLRAGIFSLTN